MTDTHISTSANGATAADGPEPIADANLALPTTSTPAKKATKKAAKKAVKKRAKKAAKKASAGTNQRTRTQRSFPASSFEDAMELANALQRMGTQKVRRLTLFEELGRSPESGPSRQLVSNSSRYGITTGGFQAEYIELTADGNLATNPEAVRRQSIGARFRLAIEGVPPFKAIFEEYKGQKLPNQSVIRDFLRERQYPEPEIQECIDTFIVNAKFVGLLKTLAGAERLLQLDHLLDDISQEPEVRISDPARELAGTPPSHVPSEVNWDHVCFYITPIGDDGTEHRQHSDLFLGSLVEPALELGEFKMQVVRADQIGKPGMITAQVIEHIVNARVVIADLSFHNPNVFYELALRHACRKPVVQLIRAADRIPFDLDQFRTIVIDTSDIYALVPQIETYRSEIANQVRRGLEGTGDVENPLTVFFPGFWDLLGGQNG
jgi:hypothetical protein